MAKLRVYELAKELNVESKKLVEKLKTGGLDIKNYMSTLDEEAARKARDIFHGTTSEVIEEKRIKPTVIRRRKKVVSVEADKEKVVKEEKVEEPPVAEKVEEAIIEKEEEPAPEIVKEKPPVREEKAIPQKEDKEISGMPSPERPEVRPKEKAKRSRKRQSTTAT